MVIRALLVASTAAALALVGCADQPSPAPALAPGTETSATTAAPAATQIDISIAGGAVTPVNAQLDATVGKPIVLRVDSDAADELHVHAVPEHTFAVTPTRGQRFEFTVDVPGRVEVELHHLDRTVVTISVRP